MKNYVNFIRITAIFRTPFIFVLSRISIAYMLPRVVYFMSSKQIRCSFQTDSALSLSTTHPAIQPPPNFHPLRNPRALQTFTTPFKELSLFSHLSELFISTQFCQVPSSVIVHFFFLSCVQNWPHCRCSIRNTILVSHPPPAVSLHKCLLLSGSCGVLSIVALL